MKIRTLCIFIITVITMVLSISCGNNSTVVNDLATSSIEVSSSSNELLNNSSSSIIVVTNSSMQLLSSSQMKSSFISSSQQLTVELQSSCSSTITSSPSSSQLQTQFNSNLSYGEYIDNRDGLNKIYKTVIIHGSPDFEVFAQNLDYGVIVTENRDQNDASKVEKYCYNKDANNCVQFGGLYEWAEAMGFSLNCNIQLFGTTNCTGSYIIPAQGVSYIQHQGICPDSWHIMNSNEWGRLFSNAAAADGSSLRANFGGWSGTNETGFSALPSGIQLDDGEFVQQGESAQYIAPEETASYVITVKSISSSTNVVADSIQSKNGGNSIRCVKNY